MRVPVLRGVIDRRILVNYRVDPDVLADSLPPPFRPKLVRGHGIAGICLIRLKAVRPRWLPEWMGVSSENAAQRIAVEWEVDGECHEGVYIPRRDTSSRLNALAGGRLIPGVHHHARFQVHEGGGFFSVALDSDDGKSHVRVDGRLTSTVPADSVFRSLAEASDFFAGGSIGYSPGAQPGCYDGLELRTIRWHAVPLSVERVESSYFEDAERFPCGSATFDSALLMRGIEHEWHSRPALRCHSHDDALLAHGLRKQSELHPESAR